MLLPTYLVGRIPSYLAAITKSTLIYHDVTGFHPEIFIWSGRVCGTSTYSVPYNYHVPPQCPLREQCETSKNSTTKHYLGDNTLGNCVLRPTYSIKWKYRFSLRKWKQQNQDDLNLLSMSANSLAINIKNFRGEASPLSPYWMKPCMNFAKLQWSSQQGSAHVYMWCKGQQNLHTAWILNIYL